ncbi:Abi family protein [Sphingomonas lacusdianchii]|uniref:Abi family protein n=1 Tax=Sphingomonas lacusdianchii TaxID=2917992 RepID=UPI002412B399|nr:Abi family protein [Sphingomonas sp. JXJ CY 53]
MPSYSSPLPIWMAVETWDFGTLSWLLEMAHPNDRTVIANRYGLLPNTFVSWIRTLAFVRNISAHHARLWNTGIINLPQVPRPHEATTMDHIGAPVARRDRVYGAAAVAAYLVKQIAPGITWSARMKAHWQAFPAMPYADPAQGGFLLNWDREAIWA